MRLPSIARAWRVGDRFKLRIIAFFSGRPPADILMLLHYRREHFGEPFTEWTHEVLRGDSEWTVGERELMATFVSRLNQCQFCAGSHGAVADATVGRDVTLAVIADWRAAGLRPPLRAAFALLEVLTLQPQEVGAEHIRAVRDAGASEEGVRTVIHLCAIFCTVNRIADAVDFARLDPDGYRADARILLKRGYAM